MVRDRDPVVAHGPVVVGAYPATVAVSVRRLDRPEVRAELAKAAHPRRAARIASISIFFICIIASNARWAAA
jgi:hypothetical protein